MQNQHWIHLANNHQLTPASLIAVAFSPNLTDNIPPPAFSELICHLPSILQYVHYLNWPIAYGACFFRACIQTNNELAYFILSLVRTKQALMQIVFACCRLPIQPDWGVLIMNNTDPVLWWRVYAWIITQCWL